MLSKVGMSHSCHTGKRCRKRDATSVFDKILLVKSSVIMTVDASIMSYKCNVMEKDLGSKLRDVSVLI